MIEKFDSHKLDIFEEEKEDLDNLQEEVLSLKESADVDPYAVTYEQMFLNFWNDMKSKGNPDKVHEKKLHIKEIYVRWNHWKNVDITMIRKNPGTSGCDYEIVFEQKRNGKKNIWVFQFTKRDGWKSVIGFKDWLFSDKKRDEEWFDYYYENNPVQSDYIKGLILELHDVIFENKLN